jgi:uracil phosphoribosyltransferase
VKKTVLTTLRDTKTTLKDFREGAEQLSYLLAMEAGELLEVERFPLQTPLTKTQGERFAKEIVIIPILRAGLAMLPSFLRIFPKAKVGFFGMRRDEETKEPHLYYENLPELNRDQEVIVIDPMLATGGSGALAIQHLYRKGIKDSQIVYVSIIAAPAGAKKIQECAPKCRLVVGQMDERLDQNAFIVPGIGDFGDRYFGTVS